MEQVKVSVNLPEDVVEALRRLADERQTSVTAVLRDAISNEVYLDNEVSDGAKILMEKDKQLRELVFPEMGRRRRSPSAKSAARR